MPPAQGERTIDEIGIAIFKRMPEPDPMIVQNTALARKGEELRKNAGTKSRVVSAIAVTEKV